MDANKRIVFNTGVIYVKLIISSIIGLFTSRIILHALGVDDYGLYTVIGGIVSFMNILAVTMVTATNRFISVEIGKGENGDINRVFSLMLSIHIALALFLLVVGETLGLYYVNHYLNVESTKLSDARFVLHFSLITTALSIITVPYHGLIVARERFLFTSVVEVTSLILKLLLVYALFLFTEYRLRLFTIILLILNIVTYVLYVSYCKNKEVGLKFKFIKNKEEYKEVFGFVWWSLFGATSFIGKEQGAAMIINSFFGTSLNAAFGLASQINRYAMMFTKGLSQAATPQIMKSYGAHDSQRSLNLVYTISRISTLIMLIMVLPLILCMDSILKIWLGVPPEYTSIFAQFMLINTMVTMLGAGFDACIQSTGQIKANEIFTSIIYLSILPIIYVSYKMGLPPYMNVVVMPFLSLAIRLMQVFIMRKLTDFKFSHYLRLTFMPSLLVAISSFVPMYILRMYFNQSLLHTLIFIVICIVWALICIAIFGMSKREREMLKVSINNMVHRTHK